MQASTLIIDTAKHLYLKHQGRNHRLIEQEMHALGHRRFTRRSLYNQKTKTGHRKGWIEKYNWKSLLQSENTSRSEHRSEDTHVLMSLASRRRCQAAQSSDLEDKSVLAPLAEDKGVLAPLAEDKGVLAPLAAPNSQLPFRSWLKRVSPNMHWDWPYQELIYKQLQKVTTGECR